MNVIPGEEPSSGPNYFNFDPTSATRSTSTTTRTAWRTTSLRVHVPERGDPRRERGSGAAASYVALPPITALDGPGSEGLGLRQRYTVTMFRGTEQEGQVSRRT